MKGTTLREEVEKLHEERNMLLETIEDLKQSVEQTGPQPETRVTTSTSQMSRFEHRSFGANRRQVKYLFFSLERRTPALNLITGE